MSQIPHVQLHPNDKHIERNRAGRILVLVLYIALVLGIGVLFGTTIFNDWFGLGIVGFFLGLMGAGFILSVTLDRFFIRVELVSAFVTVDLLQTLLSGRSRELPDLDTLEEEDERQRALDRKVFPTYGPGLHVSYPWEERDADYNFSLQEVSADITFPVLLSDGTVTLEGSYRIRPDFQNLIPFLSGVASTAEELQEILTAHAVQILSGKTVDQALGSLKELNEDLMAEFGLGSPRKTSSTDSSTDERKKDDVTRFERRFGVFVGDVTIAKILPSEEVQRTRGSITEARAIQEGTAILLGYNDAAALQAALDGGRIKFEEIRHARDRFLSISGNMEGMDLKRSEIEVSIQGLDKESIQALTELAKVAAPAAAMFAGAAGKSGSRKK